MLTSTQPSVTCVRTQVYQNNNGRVLKFIIMLVFETWVSGGNPDVPTNVPVVKLDITEPCEGSILSATLSVDTKFFLDKF